MNKRILWSHILNSNGIAAPLIGALDPLQGAFVILPASALIALNASLGGSRRPYRVCSTMS